MDGEAERSQQGRGTVRGDADGSDVGDKGVGMSGQSDSPKRPTVPLPRP